MNERREIVFPPGTGTFFEEMSGKIQLSPKIFSLLADMWSSSGDQRENLFAFLQNIPGLLDLALTAREKALSWRDFRVGCAALARDPPEDSDLPELGKFPGANLKMSEYAFKVCAELFAIQAARLAGYREVLGLVIVGDPQEDHASRLLTPTLEPCEDCRTALPNFPEVGMDMFVATFYPKAQIWEIQYLQEMIAKHEFARAKRQET